MSGMRFMIPRSARDASGFTAIQTPRFLLPIPGLSAGTPFPQGLVSQLYDRKAALELSSASKSAKAAEDSNAGGATNEMADITGRVFSFGKCDCGEPGCDAFCDNTTGTALDVAPLRLWGKDVSRWMKHLHTSELHACWSLHVPEEGDHPDIGMEPNEEGYDLECFAGSNGIPEDVLEDTDWCFALWLSNDRVTWYRVDDAWSEEEDWTEGWE